MKKHFLKPILRLLWVIFMMITVLPAFFLLLFWVLSIFVEFILHGDSDNAEKTILGKIGLSLMNFIWFVYDKIENI